MTAFHYWNGWMDAMVAGRTVLGADKSYQLYKWILYFGGNFGESLGFSILWQTLYGRLLYIGYPPISNRNSNITRGKARRIKDPL